MGSLRVYPHRDKGRMSIHRVIDDESPRGASRTRQCASEMMLNSIVMSAGPLTRQGKEQAI